MKNEIFEMYNNISIGQCSTCQECNKEDNLDLPLSFYFVGDEFKNSEKSILFVGKTAIGGDGIGPLVNEKFYDVTDFGEMSIDLKEEFSTTRAFYSYTNEIIKRHFGSYEEGKKHIAISNMVKCNNSSTNDETLYSTKQFCINELQVIWKEIEILKPKKIIFYTNKYYDDFIDQFKPSYANNIIDIIDDEENCWWHRQFLNDDNSLQLEFLRTVHPQRKNKEKFISDVLNWLNSNQ